MNPQFAKAHMRAYTCALAQGFLEKAKESVDKALALGEASMQDKVSFIEELMKYEQFAKAAMKRKEYREAVFYATRLTEQCQDSVKHLKMRIKASILHNPNDLSAIIKQTYNMQEQFMGNAVFLYWRGRLLIYNGQGDLGKKHIK